MKSEDRSNLPTLKERRRRLRNNNNEVESKVRSSQSAPLLKNIHPLPPPINPPQVEKPRGLSVTSSERYITPIKNNNNESAIKKISERAKTPLPPPLEMPSCSTYDSSSGNSNNNVNKPMKLTDKLEHYYENKEHVDDVLSIYYYIII